MNCDWKGKYMSLILIYIKKMIAYIIVSIPIYFICRTVYIKKRKVKKGLLPKMPFIRTGILAIFLRKVKYYQETRLSYFSEVASILLLSTHDVRGLHSVHYAAVRDICSVYERPWRFIWYRGSWFFYSLGSTYRTTSR